MLEELPVYHHRVFIPLLALMINIVIPESVIIVIEVDSLLIANLSCFTLDLVNLSVWLLIKVNHTLFNFWFDLEAWNIQFFVHEHITFNLALALIIKRSNHTLSHRHLRMFVAVNSLSQKLSNVFFVEAFLIGFGADVHWIEFPKLQLRHHLLTHFHIEAYFLSTSHNFDNWEQPFVYRS